MKIAVIAVCLAFLAFNSTRAQAVNNKTPDSLIMDIPAMKQDIASLKAKEKITVAEVGRLSKENAALRATADSLFSLYSELNSKQAQSKEELAKQISTTNESVRISKTELQAQVSNRTHWGVGFVIGLIVIIAVIAFYYHRKLRRGSTSIDEVRKAQEGLQKAQTSLQEESIKLDSKLVELIEAQISAAPQATGSQKPDHSLALKVADEIVRMEMNLSRMDASVKGHKQLSKAVQRIKDNFKANGYDIVDMLGKPYNEGMKVVANFVSDESLAEGQQIISSITKPQINYNGQMIQAAQITVSQNI